VKNLTILVCSVCAATIVAVTAMWFADDTLAPLFLNSRIERLHESGFSKGVD
jgi:hypothetical protein